MANLDFENDPSYSIRISFGRYLPEEFLPLITWFAEQIYTPAELRSRRNAKLRAVHCVIANLAYAAKIDPALHVGSPFGSGAFTQNRYNDSDVGHRNFRRVVERLRDRPDPFIRYHQGIHYRHIGRVGRIRATERTLRIVFGYAAHIRRNERDRAAVNNDLVNELAAIPAHQSVGEFRQEDILEQDREIIILRNAEGVDIGYRDSEETNTLRNDLQQWNEFLASNFHVDLLLTDDELLEVFSDLEDRREVEDFYGDLNDSPSVAELSKTKLYRIFNHGRFDRGGRFYGGWWQTVPSRFRRRITINSVPTVEVDYSTLHPAMLYAEEGLHLPGDAYAIDGVDPRHRELIKKTLLRLINAREGQNIRQPRENALPEGWTWEQLQQALIEKHQPIARHFRSGAGLRLMRTDSDIAAQVMRNMHLRELPVLPVHDSFLTYAGATAPLAQEMYNAYEEATGFEIDVDRDRFIENIFPDEGGNEPLHHAEQIDIALRDPAFSGYRRRWETFVRARPVEWRRRFGQGIDALEGL